MYIHLPNKSVIFLVSLSVNFDSIRRKIGERVSSLKFLLLNYVVLSVYFDVIELSDQEKRPITFSGYRT
jgi:hypothetical protein